MSGRYWLAYGPVVAVVVVAGWFGGSVATGQRGIGLSFAWLVPAVVAAVIAVMGMVIAGRPTQSGPNPPRPREDGRSALEVVRREAGRDAGGPQNPPSPPETGVWFARVPADLAFAALLVTALAVMLWASDGVNHTWATTPRARLATMAALVLLVVLPMGWRLGGMTVGPAIAGATAAPSKRGASTRIGLLASIGIGAMAFFVATASGRLVTPDEWTIYAAAVGLVEHGRLAVFDGEPYRFTLTGTVRIPGSSAGGSADEPVSAPSKYPAVGSLVVAPFYAVTRLFGAHDPATSAQWAPPERAPLGVTMLAGPAAATALVTATAWLALEAGLGWSAVIVVAIATVTASLAWPYASTLLNMGVTGAALAGAAAAALRARSSLAPRWFAVSGALLGLTAASRYEYLVLGAPVGLLLASGALTSASESKALTRRSRGAHADSDDRRRAGPADHQTTPHLIRPLGLPVAVVAWGSVVGPLVFWWNFVRTGSALDFGYGDEGFLASLLEKPWYGWFGLLFSPGCGVLVYAPLSLVSLFALAWLWEDSPPLALSSGATVFLAMAYYGSVSSAWCAQTTWGPRYLVAVAPLAMVSIGSLWARLSANNSPWRRNPFAWLALGVPWAANVVVNVLAVLVDFGRGWQDHWALGATYQVTTWVPYFSGVTAHVRLLRSWILGGEASIDVQWLRGVSGTPTVGGTAAMVVLLVVAAACVGRAWKLAGPNPPTPLRQAPSPTPPPLRRERGY